MAYLMTHSLLSSWLYSMRDNPFADATQEDSSKEDFLRVLRREPTPTTDAMANGIAFENLVTDIVHGVKVDPMAQWVGAATKIANVVAGGQLQFVATKRCTVGGLDLLLYGRLDALKAGEVYDIKFSKSYDRGKYVESTQHPMYLELVPDAECFTYLISDGNEVWTEKYRRDESPSILPIINDFLVWLNITGNIDTYKEYWRARE